MLTGESKSNMCSITVLPAMDTRLTSDVSLPHRRQQSAMKPSICERMAADSFSRPPGCEQKSMRLITSAPNGRWALRPPATARRRPLSRS